jgi:chorismate mutase/prephenate dehydratase
VHDQPGALRRALAAFDGEGLNLARVESRTPRRSAGARWWDSGYAFVDLDGHAEDERVRRALATLRDEGALVRVLGSYPRAPEEDA